MSFGWPRTAVAVVLLFLYPILGRAAAFSGGALMNDETVVEESFSTSLPLVVIEIGQDPNPDDASVRVVFRLIANDGRANHPQDLPAAHSLALMRRLDANARASDKGTYNLRLVTEQGQEHLLSFLGMEESGEWLLEGDPADKMMLRNYIGRTLAADVMPGQAPATRYCEVLLGDGRRHYYQGLYLLSEKMADGVRLTREALADRDYVAVVDLPDPSKTEDGETDERDAEQIAALRREARHMPLAYGEVRLLNPRPASAGLTDQATDELDRAENTVYSDIADVYFNYIGLHDVDSFIGSFIVNGTMANHGEGMPYYFYKQDKRIGALPRWNFTYALDNTVLPALKDASVLDESVWYRRLRLSAGFMSDLRNEYYRLVRGPLKPSRIDSLIDRLVDRLGPALQRDWRRWRALYVGDPRFALQPVAGEHGAVLERGVATVEQEIVKIKHNLRREGNMLRKSLLESRWDKYQFDYEMNARHNFFMAAIFIVAFFVVAHYARRKV